MGLNILNVGKGDTKITFDKNKPEEMERAKKIVTDMLKRGYAILVEVGEKDGKPIYYRATEFDPETAEYIIAGEPGADQDVRWVAAAAKDESDTPKSEKPRKGKKGKRVKAEGTEAVAVARSAGGMSMAANSIEMENLRKQDEYTTVRNALADIAEQKSEWAGIPMPLEHRPLVIEPSYPKAKELMEITAEEEDNAPAVDESRFHYRNTFFSHKLRCDVTIYEEDGRIKWGLQPALHSLRFQVATMDVSVAWGVEQEAAALQLLGTLVSHLQFKRYLMTGMFVERSMRSGLMYFFRKLRPTVAVSIGHEKNGEYDPRIIAALCMHPIAYYQGSWAGAMCPTDDVIAHLMLMRGDEHMFWKRCNQHHPVRPEAGL